MRQVDAGCLRHRHRLGHELPGSLPDGRFMQHFGTSSGQCGERIRRDIGE
ncbi:Protein of unknown function [Propionibacterium freudenreichii]|nr:Protein of unknown function [Propionibacterium freudenreichii]